MRRLAPLVALLALAACEGPDRSGLEDVYLEREQATGPSAYKKTRDRAYDRLRAEGPETALPLFREAYRTPGAQGVSWELLPVIARLTIRAGDRQTALAHARTARLSQRVSLGELVCQGPDQGVFVQDDGEAKPAFGPEDLGSALLVSTVMCASRDIYPKRARDGRDALFERKLAAVEAMLPPGTSGSAPKTP